MESSNSPYVRRYQRSSVRIPVDYVVDGHPRSDPAVDLSAGGAYIETKGPQASGTRLRLRFRIPDRDESFDVEGQVVWTNAEDDPSDPQRPPGMAIRFDEPLGAAALAALLTIHR